MTKRDETSALRDRAQALGLIDQAPVAVAVTDRNGTIASWNAAAEELLGWRRLEVLGRRLIELVSPESAEWIGKTVGEAFAGRAGGGDCELRDRDGHELLVHLRAAPLLDTLGNRVGVVLAALRASDEERTRRAADKSRTSAAIGRRIAQARKEAGLTQQELADRLLVTRRSVQGYESGAVVPYKRLNTLAEALGRPAAWFLAGDPETLAQSEEDLRQGLRELLHQELSSFLDRARSSAA
jgi:PAS domain S-box-containing protein